MANEFEAKVEVDTSEAAKNLKNVDSAVDKLDSTLNSLDKTLTRFQGTLSKTTAALQTATKAQRDSDTAADKSAASTLKLAQAREKDSRAALNAARTEAIANRERSATAKANATAANSFQGVTGAVRGYAEGAQDADKSTLALAGSMSNTRYLLYDIGATYTAISIALLAIPAATTAVAMSFQSSFAQVERTTAGTTANMGALKESLTDLTTQIPLSFAEINKIAALGAQLGVAPENLASFSEVVAKFSASTGMAAEEAGTAFGRIASSFGLGADSYEKLGSAIAKVGVSSEATESEIIAITQQLAPLANLAGYSAEEVIGLSGALAAMRIRPELARGAFQSTIFKMTDAVEQGGKKLQAYADIMGITADKAAKMSKQDPSGFLQAYVTGIGKAMEGGRTFSSILDELGVKEKRERQFILAMANRYGFLGEQIDLANKAYEEGTFLDESSAKVFQTLESNLKMLGNALAALGDSVGSGGLGVLAVLVGVMKDGAVAVADFIKQNEMLGKVLSVLMAFGAVVGVFFAVRAAMAFVMAAMVGFQQVAGKAALQTTFSLKGLAAQAAVTALVTKGATAQMAGDFVRMNGTMAAGSAAMVRGSDGVVTSITKQGGALRGLGSVMSSAVGGPIGILIGLLGVLGMALFETKQKAESAGQAIASGLANGVEEGVAAAAAALKTIEVGLGSNIEIGNWGKSFPEIAKEAGVSFETIVASAAKGKAGIAEFNKTVDDIARSQGYKDLNDMRTKNPFAWAGDSEKARKLEYLRKTLESVANETDKTTSSSEAADKAVESLTGNSADMEEFGDETDKTSSAFDKLSQNIDDAAKKAFGLVNAGAAANEALYKLGQSLQESNDLSIDSEGGRENMANAQEAVTSYALSLAQAQADGKMTAEAAAADYAAYIDGLFNELLARGVDPTQAAAFVESAKTVMQGAAQSGTPVTVPIEADGSQVAAEAAGAANVAQQQLDAAPPVARVQADTQPAGASIGDFASAMIMLFGQPYVAAVSADTSSGVQNVDNFTGYTGEVVADPFVASVTADTTSGQNNLIAFANWARSVLDSIQLAIAVVTGNINAAQDSASNDRVAGDKTPISRKTQDQAPVRSAPVNIPAAMADSRPTQALKNLGQGYDDAAAKAAKAGSAGKKAGDDAAKAHKTAAEEVNDYANRLQTGLQAAYDAQHGLQKATDDYYSQLNSIAKKREDDLRTIQGQIDKQKELNNAREGDLVAARKAEIEAGISRKYGEGDRARDYEQQAEEARLAAAEKQKNIDVSRSEQAELERGMNALDGYSQAAIDNRNALRDLESKMLGMITAYAQTGASQQQVANYADNLTKVFGIQVSQMGYNQGSVNALIGTTQRYIDTIYRIPYRVFTDSENDFGQAASQAQGLSNAIGAIPNSTKTTARISYSSADLRRMAGIAAGTGNLVGSILLNAHAMAAEAQGFHAGGEVKGYATGGLIPGTPPSDPSKDNMLAKVDGKGLAAIRSGEFIQPQPAVDYYGLPFMEAIRNMTLPRYNVGGPVGVPRASSGASGGSGVQLVELTAENINAILRLADRPVVMYADAQEIAATANEGNRILASKGVRN